jgi:carboxymethylenebutenolidase
MALGERIKLTAGDGFTFNAYRAELGGAPRGGVVVIQEVWGINRWVREVADRFARHGYVAVAPALFDRIAMGFESDDYANGSIRAKHADAFASFSPDDAMKDVEAAVRSASDGGKVGITGYCFGGMITWRSCSAGLGLAAGSGYYGGGVPNYIHLKPQVPIEMHFGGKDKGIPLEQVEQLREQHPQAHIHVYEGAVHGFCNSDRPEHFNEAACKKASARTLEFFREHLA